MLISRVRNARSSGNNRYPTAPSTATTNRPASSGAKGSFAVAMTGMGMDFDSAISVGPPKQAVGKQRDDQDDGEIEKKFAIFGREIFAGGVRQSEQQRRRQGAGDRTGAADRHHHQKRDHVAQRIERFDREQFGADDSAERGETDRQGERREIENFGPD